MWKLSVDIENENELSAEAGLTEPNIIESPAVNASAEVNASFAKSNVFTFVCIEVSFFSVSFACLPYEEKTE